MKLATIGYEGASMQAFLETLQQAGVDLLVDIRAVAASRRPGFAKTALAANLKEAGIDYLHLRGLGTPAEGRAAARADRQADLERIYRDHLTTIEAQDQLHALFEIVKGPRKACLMCYEADAMRCHRRFVAQEVAAELPVEIEHLTLVR